MRYKMHRAVHTFPSVRRMHEALTPAERLVRRVAFGIKDEHRSAEFKVAGESMADYALSGQHGPPVLVPMPGSRGHTDSTHKLCKAIAAHIEKTRGEKCDIVHAVGRARPVQSSMERHQKGMRTLKPEEHHMVATGALTPEHLKRPVYLIDNVTTTGSTAEAANRALKQAHGEGKDFRGLAYAGHPEHSYGKQPTPEHLKLDETEEYMSTTPINESFEELVEAKKRTKRPKLACGHKGCKKKAEYRVGKSRLCINHAADAHFVHHQKTARI